MNTPVSACLLSWRRPSNLPPIVASLAGYDFIDEILIWNNDPDVRLDVAGPKVRVIQSERNLGCAARYLCAAQARNDVVYTQDDDVLVLDVRARYESFLADPSRICHGLSEWHYPRRDQHVFPLGHLALLGWGSFFRRSWIDVLATLPDRVRQSALFERQADTYFTIGLARQHNTMLGDLRQLPGNSDEHTALWRQPEHAELSALAVREALRLTRERVRPVLPARWHVVITCCDYADYLAECVRSVVLNEVDCVVTIVDDASSDDTWAVARSLAADYSGVHCLQAPHRLGPGASANLGLAAQDSVFAVRLDADDRIGPAYLATADALLSAGAEVANPDAVLFGTESGTWTVPSQVDLPDMLEHNHVHSAAAFRRGWWAQVGGFDEELPGWLDYDFWIRMVAAGARVRALPGLHFFHRRHPGSLGSRNSPTELRRLLEAKHADLYARARDRPEPPAPRLGQSVAE